MLHESLSGPWTLVISSICLFLGIVAIGFYLAGVARSSRNIRLRRWPLYRSLCWCAGVLLAAAVMSAPFMDAAHHDFRLHMAGHLMLGMAAPLLLALGAPATLLLRSLRTDIARKAARVLKSAVFSFYRHPVTASVLNIGGLWILYTTPLFGLMHMHPLLYLFVHVHVFLAGYLFTVSMIYMDPAPRPHSPLFRTAVFIPALAAHGILSKFIYAQPPDGIPPSEARQGAMIMYYGGDLVDLVIIILLFHAWYKSTAIRRVRKAEKKPVIH